MKSVVFRLDLAAKVDRGLVRESNEDYARVARNLSLAILADGMGGHDSGEVASHTAADALWLSLERQGGPGSSVNEARERLLQAFQQANAQVGKHPAAGQGSSAMGTTLVAALFVHGRALVAHVGDSRCYRLRGRSLELLTQDHSFAAEMARRGLDQTPEEKAVASQYAHVLTRCVNGSVNMEVDLRVERCEPGDIFLLCSDGLWGCVSQAEITRALAEADGAAQACDKLISAAWAGGGLDNIAVAVARLVPSTARVSEPLLLAQDEPPPTIGV